MTKKIETALTDWHTGGVIKIAIGDPSRVAG